MRTSSLRVIFHGVLVAGATMGANPCVSYVCGPGPQELEPDSGSLADAGPEAGYVVNASGAVELTGDAGVVLPLDYCNVACGTANGGYTAESCSLQLGDAGGVVLLCDFPIGCPGGGRRTAGVEIGRVRAPTPVGDYLGACTALEAASVRSFRRLRRELHRLGAPRALLRACSRAARDEGRHARALASLARREGGGVGGAREEPMSRRSIEALAIENAVEGCVFETFGALLAHWQAAHAREPHVRGAMARLAHDETRHAALAWTMAAWLERRLPAPARARVTAARSGARERLLRRLAREPATELVARGLLPGAAEAGAMARRLAAALPR